jgi:guanylate kinase
MIEAHDQNKAGGKLIVISGPSGVGKSTITREIVRRLDEAYFSVSMTTRPQAAGEQNGREYWFVSEEEFRRRIEQGLFLEYAEVFGNLYGTPRDKINEALQAGRTVILEIDIQGAKQAKAAYPKAALVFILPPSAKVLTERISGRARESQEMIERRLANASAEIAAAWQYYDRMVINDGLEQAIEEIVEIIRQVPGIGEQTNRN